MLVAESLPTPRLQRRLFYVEKQPTGPNFYDLVIFDLRCFLKFQTAPVKGAGPKDSIYLPLTGAVWNLSWFLSQKLLLNLSINLL